MFLGFKSLYNYADFYIYNPDFSLIRNWKVLKIWRLNLINSPFKVSLFITLIIPVSSLLADPVPADGSPASLISESSPLPEPEPAPVPLALPVPDSVPPFPVLGSIPEPLPVPLALPVPDSVPPLLPVSVAGLEWGSSAPESHKGSLLISAYC